MPSISFSVISRWKNVRGAVRVVFNFEKKDDGEHGGSGTFVDAELRWYFLPTILDPPAFR
jgi:hypothetical protein